MESLEKNEFCPTIITATPTVIQASAKFQMGEKKTKNYYVNESVGIASGFLLTALHNAGLATLTHTPAPMGFLEKLLNRPNNEKAILLIPVGFPSDNAEVPDLKKKLFKNVCNII